jgi:D-threo-aldose 1-dehydrogenase
LRTRPLPGTPLALTELGFGAAPLGNLYTAISDEQAEATVDAAWAAGIRYFDTAPHYGLGLSERRLGRALQRYPRNEYVLSTKVGRLLVPRTPPAAHDDDDIFEVPGDLERRWDVSRDGVRRSLEESLERLGLDRVDILYLHDPDVSGVPDAVATGVAALVELREEGVVTAVGIGSNSAATIADAFRTTDMDLAMLAGRYSLLEHDVDDVFAAAGSRSIVAAGIFNSGLLAHRRPPETATYDYRQVPQAVLERARALATAAEAHGATLPQAALAFPLRNGQVASEVVGMSSPEQVAEDIGLHGTPVPAALWRELGIAG